MSMSNQGEPRYETPMSAAERVYQLIKERIVLNVLPPGERLTEIKMAEEFGTSRTPVREAFHRLEQEGLIERSSQGGLRITPISLTALNDLYGIRAVLASYAAELACERIGPLGLEALKEINRQGRDLIDDPNTDSQTEIAELFRLNTMFHESIEEAAQNEFLTKTLRLLRDMVLRFRLYSLYDPQRRREAHEEHEQLVELLEQRRAEDIARLMRGHILRGRDNVVAGLVMDLKSRPGIQTERFGLSSLEKLREQIILKREEV